MKNRIERVLTRKIQKELESRFKKEIGDDHCVVIETEEMDSQMIEDGGCIVIRDGVVFAIQFSSITSSRKLDGLLEKMRKTIDSMLI